jgi:hypothetical protein
MVFQPWRSLNLAARRLAAFSVGVWGDQELEHETAGKMEGHIFIIIVLSAPIPML